MYYTYDISIDKNSITGDAKLLSNHLEMLGYKVIREDDTMYISNIESEDLYALENMLKLNNIKYIKYKIHCKGL